MPFDGSGNFSRLYSWQSDRDNGIKILASRMDGEFDNFAAGMNSVFFRNGLVPMSGNLNMGQNYIYGIGSGSVGNLPIRFGDDTNSGFFLDGIGKPSVVAGGAKRLEINTTGVNVFGSLLENGSRVWSAATLDPTLYAPLAGATFTNTVNISTPGTSYLTLTSAGSLKGSLASTNTTNDVYLNSAGGNVVLTNAGYPTVTISPSFTSIISAGEISARGYQVWHAGNLNPSAYAQLSGSTFTGGVGAPFFYANGAGQGGALIGVSGGSGGIGNVSFRDSAGAERAYIGSNSATQPLIFGSNYGFYFGPGPVNTQGVQVNGNNVWHAGNFFPSSYQPVLGYTPYNATNPAGYVTGSTVNAAISSAVASYAPLAGATFTGAIKRDAQYSIDLADGNTPFLQFDNGDQIVYIRSANKFFFNIGGVSVASIDSSGTLRTLGNIIANTAP